MNSLNKHDSDTKTYINAHIPTHIASIHCVRRRRPTKDPGRFSGFMCSPGPGLFSKCVTWIRSRFQYKTFWHVACDDLWIVCPNSWAETFERASSWKKPRQLLKRHGTICHLDSSSNSFFLPYDSMIRIPVINEIAIERFSKRPYLFCCRQQLLLLRRRKSLSIWCNLSISCSCSTRHSSTYLRRSASRW